VRSELAVLTRRDRFEKDSSTYQQKIEGLGHIGGKLFHKISVLHKWTRSALAVLTMAR